MQADQSTTYYNEMQRSGITSNQIEQQYKTKVLSLPQLDYSIQKDIKNFKGALLAPAGTKITDDIYQKILNHRLQEPIDEYLGFGSQVSAPKIMKSLSEIGEQNFNTNGLDFSHAIKRIETFVDQIQLDHMSLNKLTVLKEDNPTRYGHALTTALMSTEIGIHLGYTRGQLIELFSASLFHDIGELHVGQAAYEQEILVTEDSKSIRVHPIVSYLILSASKTKFSKATLYAVLHHHERLDGSGYPLKLKGDKINQYARILGVTDTYHAIRSKGGSIEDALSVLQFSSSATSTGRFANPALCNTIVSAVEARLLTSSNPPDQQPTDEIGTVETALSSFEDISNTLSDALINLQDLIHNANTAELDAIKNLYHLILNTKKYWIDSSGIDYYAAHKDMQSEEFTKDARQVLFQVAPRMSNSITAICEQVKTLQHKNPSEIVSNMLLGLERALQRAQQDSVRIQQQFYPQDFVLS